ncbi:integrase arm-type DNA-binding domain-containing protein [Asticcacaulis excentricus]|uniref:integrase arm-type DNA-binding domain-containing protein n=1 Tax=Asticcacaulis excentricus TaxID=78587 RepID=UPI002F9345AD
MTDTAIRAAKPLDKQYKLYDSGGLFMIVRPSGQKLWRFKYPPETPRPPPRRHASSRV